MACEQALAWGKILWDYHHLGHELTDADAIFVLGSHDLRVADYAAEIFLQGYAPWIIFSGGLGNLTQYLWDRPEAELFAERAKSVGVPEEKILIEPRSTNTGENVCFTRDLLKERGLDFSRFILVQKPYMERRAFATFSCQWPGKEAIAASPPIGFEDYPTPEISMHLVLNVMVGDLQRIRIYPDLGYQISQEIPSEVLEAFQGLVDLGYTEHLIET